MTFTYEELKQFALAQPLDAPIDMDDTRGDFCGCLLVQFARHKAGKPTLRVWAGYSGVTTTEESDEFNCESPIACEQLIHRAINCQVSKYSELLHLF